MGSKKRKAASTPSAAAAAPTEEARVAALQAWLLAAGGTIHPSLRFGNDGNGGIGVFATRLIEAETDLFVVPRQCIISLDTVRESRLGRELCDAVRALDGELADEEATEIATWILMVTGRRDPQHAYHAYLASLPAVPDDVACWPAAHRGGGLEATPVAGEVQQAVDLAEYCMGLAARLPDRLLPQGGGVSAADVLWARGVFLSRGFPDALLADGTAPNNQNSSLGGLVGCLLPVLDLANHQAGAEVSWSGSAAGVALRNHTAIEAGAEVHNNYGDKDNESLLLHYGFCQRDNPHDAVRVAVSMPAFNAEEPPQREVFLVRRREEGGVPAELLEALARVARVISAAEAAHDAGGDAAAVAAAAAAVIAMLEGKEAGEEAGEGEEAARARAWARTLLRMWRLAPRK